MEKSMEQIKVCTENLISAILGSEEYQNFCTVRDKIKEDPELRKQLMEFRKNVYQVQNVAEPLDMYEEQQRLGRRYEEFRKNPLVIDFLKAELRVCRIVQGISMAIVEQIDLDVQGIVEDIAL